MAAVEPDEECRSADEVEDDVGDAEERRHARDPMGSALNGALSEDV